MNYKHSTFELPLPPLVPLKYQPKAQDNLDPRLTPQHSKYFYIRRVFL
ncbi:hypothetical protein [Aeromonas phage Akh-2]|nr:hypothetical protein [Aeromonas phage Akh-2]